MKKTVGSLVVFAIAAVYVADTSIQLSRLNRRLAALELTAGAQQRSQEITASLQTRIDQLEKQFAIGAIHQGMKQLLDVRAIRDLPTIEGPGSRF
jgi:hypothetical protein